MVERDQRVGFRIVGRGISPRRGIRHEAEVLRTPFLYAAGIGLAFVNAWLSIALYAVVAVIWLVPDRRIEKALREG